MKKGDVAAAIIGPKRPPIERLRTLVDAAWMSSLVMIPRPTSDSPAAGLSAQQVDEMLSARQGAKKIRRAVSVARFDAWMIAFFAAVTGLTGLFSPPSLALAAVMGFAAWREFKLARDLTRLSPAAPRAMACNQLILAAALIGYALWQMAGASGSESYAASLSQGDAQVTQMLAPIDELMKLLTMSIYGMLILVAIFAQGGAALYYSSRAKHLKTYLAQTPHWIRQLQQQGLAI